MDQKRGRGNTGNTRSVAQLNQDTIRGRAAKELLENKTLQAALEAIEKGCLETIRNCALEEKDKRENAYLFLKAHQKFTKTLSEFVIKGGNAKAYLDKELKHG